MSNDYCPHCGARVSWDPSGLFYEPLDSDCARWTALNKKERELDEELRGND